MIFPALLLMATWLPGIAASSSPTAGASVVAPSESPTTSSKIIIAVGKVGYIHSQNALSYYFYVPLCTDVLLGFVFVFSKQHHGEAWRRDQYDIYIPTYLPTNQLRAMDNLTELLVFEFWSSGHSVARSAFGFPVSSIVLFPVYFNESSR